LAKAGQAELRIQHTNVALLYRYARAERSLKMATVNTKLLRSLRKENGLTQGELADKVGIGQSFISKIEKGHLEPSLATLGRLAKVLGTDIKSLLK
jgi:DNA-binding XRE family transcriptional regulator